MPVLPRPQIEIKETAKTDRSVRIKARKHPQPDTMDHIMVVDILDLAEALKEAGAPLDGQIRATMVRNGVYLIKSLATYWTESHDLVNGQPAPQAEEVHDGQDQADAS